MSCPSFKGVHRQVLLTTVGWFLGYHLTKYENYFYAKIDRDMNHYIQHHPEEFPQKGQQTVTVEAQDLFVEHKGDISSSIHIWFLFVSQQRKRRLQRLSSRSIPCAKWLLTTVDYWNEKKSRILIL